MALDRTLNFERALKNESEYDVVNFLSKRDKTRNMSCIEPPKMCDLKSQLSGVPYNILNQSAYPGREDDCRKIDEHIVVIPETKIVREFDIVTNN